MSSPNPAIKIPRERLSYSAIVDRPRRKLPGGARVVVWPIVNVEDWDINRPMPRVVIPAHTGIAVLPDIANWGWHEYGMRVGFWRHWRNDQFRKRRTNRLLHRRRHNNRRHEHGSTNSGRNRGHDGSRSC